MRHILGRNSKGAPASAGSLDSEGVVLLWALLIMFVLAITTAGTIQLVTSNEQAFGRDNRSTSALNISEAGLNAAFVAIKAAATRRRPPPATAPSITAPGRTTATRAQDTDRLDPVRLDDHLHRRAWPARRTSCRTSSPRRSSRARRPRRRRSPPPRRPRTATASSSAPGHRTARIPCGDPSEHARRQRRDHDERLRVGIALPHRNERDPGAGDEQRRHASASTSAASCRPRATARRSERRPRRSSSRPSTAAVTTCSSRNKPPFSNPCSSRAATRPAARPTRASPRRLRARARTRSRSRRSTRAGTRTRSPGRTYGCNNSPTVPANQSSYPSGWTATSFDQKVLDNDTTRNTSISGSPTAGSHSIDFGQIVNRSGSGHAANSFDCRYYDSSGNLIGRLAFNYPASGSEGSGNPGYSHDLRHGLHRREPRPRRQRLHRVSGGRDDLRQRHGDARERRRPLRRPDLRQPLPGEHRHDAEHARDRRDQCRERGQRLVDDRGDAATRASPSSTGTSTARTAPRSTAR